MEPQRDGYKEASAHLQKMGQEHLLRFWDDLNEQQRQQLLEQILDLDPDVVNRLQTLVRDGEAESDYVPGSLEPATVYELPRNDSEREKRETARKTGEELLRSGVVGAVLVAGGQGTRLGFDGPKGTFEIGPITRRTLFQYFIEKIRKREKRFSTTIPLYIMTSKVNHEDTIGFFKDHDYFGKDPESIRFFRQGMLPSFGPDGNILLKSKSEISLSPDGHGGLLSALKRHGLIEEMKTNGLNVLYYFQVDNVLVDICDPTFLGMHRAHKADMSAKTVYKRDPEEKLGNIGKRDGKYTIIEYSELSDKEKYARGDDGKLIFGQGSIALHVFDVAFLETIVNEKKGLPYHLAHKKVPYVDTDGNHQDPDTPNAFKLEQFIFDAFPFARNVVVMETDRSKEFSPVKNASGSDSPQTARRDLVNTNAELLEACGVTVPRDSDGNCTITIEISPLYALTQQELCENYSGPQILDADVLLE
jgi:UDP-N-acetylglucosamine/UDP-N-acetylgalactosamine diphosphorylase